MTGYSLKVTQHDRADSRLNSICYKKAGKNRFDI